MTYLLEVLGLGDHCDGIFYSAALGCRKPDISFFEKASTLSGLPPDQLLLVDDTYANITAAKVSGWNAAQWLEGSWEIEGMGDPYFQAPSTSDRCTWVMLDPTIRHVHGPSKQFA